MGKTRTGSTKKGKFCLLAVLSHSRRDHGRSSQDPGEVLQPQGRQQVHGGSAGERRCRITRNRTSSESPKQEGENFGRKLNNRFNDDLNCTRRSSQ